ncbi:MAG: hypothetical protein H0T99_07855 [Geodermatophilaceae bacterium]|nr:hypothetical protein [Geodermatophilaceae bacterium]
MTTDPRARRSPAVRVAVLVLCALIGLLAVRVLRTSIIENWRPDYIRHALFLC